jgi:hypothetical protein
MSRPLEERLKALQSTHRQNFIKNYSMTWIKFSLALLVFSCALMPLALAQGDVMSPNQGESDGVNAGGNWTIFHSEDKMTGAKNVRVELLSNNYLSDPDYKPRVELTCTNGKYVSADFNPGIRLGMPNRPGFWGQPQMEVMVRVDGSHDYHGWNWIRGRFLSMDKGTVREMLGANIFNVQIRGSNGQPEIAEFSPAGIDLAQMKHACDLTPKKP